MVNENRRSLDELTQVANVASTMSVSDINAALRFLIEANSSGNGVTPESYLQAGEAIVAARKRLELVEPRLRESLEKATARKRKGIQFAKLEVMVLNNLQLTFEAYLIQVRLKAEFVLLNYVPNAGKLEGNGREILEAVVTCSEDAYSLAKRLDARPSAVWLETREECLPLLFNVWSYSANLLHLDAFNRAKSAYIVAELQGELTGRVTDAEVLRIIDYGRDSHRWGMMATNVLDTASEQGISLANDKFRADMAARNKYLLKEILELDKRLQRRGSP